MDTSDTNGTLLVIKEEPVEVAIEYNSEEIVSRDTCSTVDSVSIKEEPSEPPDYGTDVVDVDIKQESLQRAEAACGTDNIQNIKKTNITGSVDVKSSSFKTLPGNVKAVTPTLTQNRDGNSSKSSSLKSISSEDYTESSYDSDDSFQEKKKPHKCRENKKSFAQSKHKVNNMIISTGEKLYICQECGESFNESHHLRCHIRTHTGQKSYSCKQCDKSFPRSGELRIHTRIHTGEKPYTCKECGKYFSQRGNLVRHMRTHTGEKPHACKECGKSFSRPGDIQRHMIIHIRERPYICTECGKSFLRSGDVKIHMRYHTKVKAHICTVCKKSFYLSGGLKRHMATHKSKRP